MAALTGQPNPQFADEILELIFVEFQGVATARQCLSLGHLTHWARRKFMPPSQLIVLGKGRIAPDRKTGHDYVRYIVDEEDLGNFLEAAKNLHAVFTQSNTPHPSCAFGGIAHAIIDVLPTSAQRHTVTDILHYLPIHSLTLVTLNGVRRSLRSFVSRIGSDIRVLEFGIGIGGRTDFDTDEEDMLEEEESSGDEEVDDDESRLIPKLDFDTALVKFPQLRTLVIRTQWRLFGEFSPVRDMYQDHSLQLVHTLGKNSPKLQDIYLAYRHTHITMFSGRSVSRQREHFHRGAPGQEWELMIGLIFSCSRRSDYIPRVFGASFEKDVTLARLARAAAACPPSSPLILITVLLTSYTAVQESKGFSFKRDDLEHTMITAHENITNPHREAMHAADIACTRSSALAPPLAGLRRWAVQGRVTQERCSSPIAVVK
ncbi:hypothetical protein DFP72DRAFT_1101960 [Ephemerocybe angulata]|uniref:Uncharacterized protein n=1 Tax=Ephemerocybe angulata TaxID=980116 RepID=A0A8H6HB17_9AGAR|nr:hypothetical protein DFP72DRAFT_1101960 [Tulosesus angulatus]